MTRSSHSPTTRPDTQSSALERPVVWMPLDDFIQTVACLAITHPTNPFALHIAGAALASFACHASARKHSKRIFHEAWTPSPSSINLDALEDVLRDLEQAMRHWDEMARWLEPFCAQAYSQKKWKLARTFSTFYEEYHNDLFDLQMRLEDIRTEVIAASTAHASQTEPAATDDTADTHAPAVHPEPQEQKGGAY